MKWVGIILSVLLLGLGMYQLLRNLAFSFATMLFVAIVFIALEYWYNMHHPQQANQIDSRRPFAIMLVGCFGLVAMFAMSYYFYPDKEVFSNNDHHAIAVEGIETSRNSLLLAADDRNAFFDDHTMAGSIELSNISTDNATARLHITGAGMPVYSLKKMKIGGFLKKSSLYYVAMDGQDNIHSWPTDQQLELLNNRNETVARLKVEYTKEWKWKRLKHVWLSNYIISYDDEGELKSDTSTIHKMIRRHYSLGELFPNLDTLHGIDIKKIELLRPIARTTVTDEDDDELVKSPFLVCHTNESGLGGFRSGNEWTPVTASCDVDIKLDSTHSIGLNGRIPEFRLMSDTSGLVAVRYRMPLYRYLNTDGYEKGEGHNKEDQSFTFMVTTTLMTEDGKVNGQIPQNILLYDVFDHPDNRYQMNPQFISFRRGSTRDPLVLGIMDNDNGSKSIVNAGERLPDIGTSDARTNWIVSLDNFRDPSLARPKGIDAPLSDLLLLAFMFLITVLCCCSMAIKKWSNYFTYIEPISYIILLSLLAIRLTLLWRASVFPPASGISLAEFNKWRTADGIFYWIATSSIALVLLVIIIKWVGFKKKKHEFRCLDLNFWTEHFNADYPTFTRRQTPVYMRDYLWPQGSKQYWLLISCFALYFVILIIGLITRKAGVCVGLPVIWYYVVDFIINVQVASRMTDKNNNSYAHFWQGLINSFIASGVMFILDGGYGLVFFIFSLLYTIIRFFDLWGANYYNKKTGTGIHRIGVIVLAIGIMLSIIFMRWIVTQFYTSTRFVYIAGLVIAAFVALTIWTVSSWRKFRGWNLLLVVCSAIITAGGCLIFKHITKGSHSANRVMVLANEPSKVLGQVTTTPDVTRFLEASLNDWVLEEYMERGRDVNSLLGDHGHGYFKLQPHSNVGVSWMTQLTDLAVSRFMIAEQSNLVPILLIFLFFIMELVGLAFRSDRRWAKSLLIQIPLLLAVQSLMVWMAVTRRFVFIGQDFPMISLLSRVNLLISIIGFFFWILTAILEYKDLRYQSVKGDTNKVNRLALVGLINGNNKYSRFIKRYTPYLFGGILATLVLIISLGQADQHQPKESTYDVTECMGIVKKLIADPKCEFDNIEILFSEFQDERIAQENQKRPKNKQIYDITKLGSPQEIFKDFCNSYGYESPDIEDPNNAIVQVFAHNKDYGPFVKASFDDFRWHKMYQNDIEGLIYIVKRRYVEEDNPDVENVRYTLGVTSRFFRHQLPRRIDKSWRGSIIAEVVSNSNTVSKKNEPNVDVYIIPASWTENKHSALIVKPTSTRNRFSVVGKYEPRVLNRNEAYYLSEGEVLTGTNPPDLAKYGSGNYLARNVLINSRPQFIYPMQNEFYYARPLAEQIGGYMTDSMCKTKNDNNLFTEIRSSHSEVTLSTSLTRDLIHAIHQKAPNGNVAVVVADGDGKVRAMVEHRQSRYDLNPNDSRRIQFLEDSLKREGLLNHGHEAERYFGNKAILSLNNGPGSSQKPIVWTAVTTQYSGWDWNSLEMSPINNNLMRMSGKYYDAPSFARAPMPLNKQTGFYFRSIKSDEGGGNVVNVKAYMRQSSNYYNAIMVYIGSHTKAELEAGFTGRNPLLASRNSSWLNTKNNNEENIAKYRDSLFPLVNYDGRIYSFARPLREENIREGGILLDGLSQNFGLPASYSNKKSTDLHKAMRNDTMISNYYAFPEYSFFNNKTRAGREGRLKEVAREGIKMTAIGKNSVWLVSPLKMAEMYGKLISFNSNYRLTIDPNIEKPSYQPFSTDFNSNEYLIMRKKQFIPGLHEVYTNSSQGGTASGDKIYNKISSNLGTYHIYGKTGTIDGQVKKRSAEDHLLAVIITNKDLDNLNTVDEYKDLRFYVIYIADFDYKHDGFSWTSVDPAIINTVLTSNEFKQYMEGAQ